MAKLKAGRRRKKNRKRGALRHGRLNNSALYLFCHGNSPRQVETDIAEPSLTRPALSGLLGSCLHNRLSINGKAVVTGGVLSIRFMYAGA
jgi:hypothetical protein